ncbi:MAG TPA: DUF1292 domain-containing protein [Firmicutes bacterium]|jgi:hypothetical protein|nr:DUF1292 domain-containing protein [Bacillota bacterium]
MSHQHEEDNWIILEDENNQQYRYSFERTLELDDKTYVILIPELQEDPNAEEAHVFRLENDENNDEILVEIEEDELEKIQAFLEAQSEQDAFEDEGDEAAEDHDDEAVDLTELEETDAVNVDPLGSGEAGAEAFLNYVNSKLNAEPGDSGEGSGEVDGSGPASKAEEGADEAEEE